MTLENVLSHRSVYDEIENAQYQSVGTPSGNIQPTFSSAPPSDETKSSDHTKNDVRLKVTEFEDYQTSVTEEKPSMTERFHEFYPKVRMYVHIFWACFFTSWWISILCQKSHRPHWLIPTVFWGAIMLRLVFWYIPSAAVVAIAKQIWDPCVAVVEKLVPKKLRPLASFGILMTVHLLATFIDQPQDGSARLDKFISFLGYWLCIGLFYISSNNRKAIDWKAVFSGILLQFVLGLFILRTGAGHDLFIFIAKLCQRFLAYSKVGTTFLFSADLVATSGYFTVSVFPAIMFFSSTIYVLSYMGWVHWIVQKISSIFTWGMNLSGMEAIVAAASPFIGQGEASILLKPFLPFATLAEFHTMSALGFSTISGGAIVSYAGLGLNISALLTSAIMSVPAAIALTRLRYPETEEQVTKGGKIVIDNKEGDEADKAHNLVHAFSLGSWTGIMVSLAIFTNLLCINATISMLDAILTWFGSYWKIKALTLEMIVGYIMYPMTFFLGVSRSDVYKVSKLVGTKLIYNEYNAYEELLSTVGASKRSQMLATYVLCSYANIGTAAEKVAIMVRLAPMRSKDITGIVWSSLATGFMASFLTASFAGCITVDVDAFSVTS